MEEKCLFCNCFRCMNNQKGCSDCNSCEDDLITRHCPDFVTEYCLTSLEVSLNIEEQEECSIGVDLSKEWQKDYARLFRHYYKPFGASEEKKDKLKRITDHLCDFICIPREDISRLLED